MKGRSLKDRIYRRDSGIYYADFRAAGFDDVLRVYNGEFDVPRGGVVSLRTKEYETAYEKAVLLRAQLKKFKAKGVEDRAGDPLLREQIERWLQVQKGRGLAEVSRETYHGYLDSFHEFMWMRVNRGRGQDREPRLSDVTFKAVQDYRAWRGEEETPHGDTTSPRTVNASLNTVSRMLEDAVDSGYMDSNPADRVKPVLVNDTTERTFLSVAEGARLIKAAREMVTEEGSQVGAYFAGVIPTFLLTGGRKKEVLGLTWEDVEWDSGRGDPRGRIRFRSNRHRDLKTSNAVRSIPLWPQLRETLEWYRDLMGTDSGLMFPSPRTGKMLTEVRKSFDNALERAEIEKDVTLHTLRHTYCAMRLATKITDRQGGLFLVMREMGHGDLSLIQDIYGHVQDSWPRLGKFVEYRDEQDVIPISAAAGG